MLLRLFVCFWSFCKHLQGTSKHLLPKDANNPEGSHSFQQRINPTYPQLPPPPRPCRQYERFPRSSVSTLIHLPPFIISTPANRNAIAVRDQISGKVASDNLYQRGDLRDASAPVWATSFAVPKEEFFCRVTFAAHFNGKQKPLSGYGRAQVHVRPQREKQVFCPCTDCLSRDSVREKNALGAKVMQCS